MAKKYKFRSGICGGVPCWMLMAALAVFCSTAKQASAGMFNLTSPGTIATVGNGVFLSGTGIKHNQSDAFLTTQEDVTSDADLVVTAFNGASANSGNAEAIFSGGKTHTIILEDIPLTSDEVFRVLLFDANQFMANHNGSNGPLEITELKVYTSTNGLLNSLSQLSTPPAPPDNINMVYDLDSGDSTNSLLIQGDNGTGGADMYFYLPDSLFGSLPDSTFVYLQIQYANPNDGPDAWMVAQDDFVNPLLVPEPASMALWVAGGSAGLFWRRRRKLAKSA